MAGPQHAALLRVAALAASKEPQQQQRPGQQWGYMPGELRPQSAGTSGGGSRDEAQGSDQTAVAPPPAQTQHLKQQPPRVSGQLHEAGGTVTHGMHGA